jgi:hypothetical protein
MSSLIEIEKTQKEIEVKEERKNIFQKLLEVRKSVPYIQKGAKGFNYNYTKESQILGSIRGKMDEEGVWLDMEMLSIEPVSISVYDSRNKKFNVVDGIRANFEFTLTNCDNPEEKIIRHQILQESGSDVKTIGGLETYANKYFMLKFFNIPNDDLDPDKFEKSIEVATSLSLTEEQIKEVAALLNGDKNAWQTLNEKFGYSKVSSIPQDKYDNVVNYLKLYNVKKEKESNNES